MFVVDFEYPGLAGQPSEHPGGFRRLIQDFSRVPAIGESIAFEGRFVGRVTWVLWRVDGRDPEVHVEAQEGYSLPKRLELEEAGWEDV